MECADKNGCKRLCFINQKTLKIESYINEETMEDINLSSVEFENHLDQFSERKVIDEVISLV